MITKQNLNNAFDSAIKENASYVGVKVSAEGTEECIVIPSKSFEDKRNFYNRAYTEELIHSMNSKVKIVGFTHGDWSDIEELI